MTLSSGITRICTEAIRSANTTRNPRVACHLQTDITRILRRARISEARRNEIGETVLRNVEGFSPHWQKLVDDRTASYSLVVVAVYQATHSEATRLLHPRKRH